MIMGKAIKAYVRINHFANSLWALDDVFGKMRKLLIYKYIVYNKNIKRDCTRERFRLRYPLEDLKYSRFSFLRSGVEAKRGVELRHSTRNSY